MAVWMVRAGKDGEWEDWALEQGRVGIHFGVAQDLSSVASKEDVEKHVREAHPDLHPKRVVNQTGQLWTFLDRIKINELVVLPLKTQSAIAVGEVVGGYEYLPDITGQKDTPLHVRRVKWLDSHIARFKVDQDILYSLGSLLTVCRVRRENAEEHLRSLADGTDLSTPAPDPDESGPFDVAEVAEDAIRRHIDENLDAREFESLIEAILKAQGYETWLSPKGPDGGVDVLAGRGPMGFDSPHLVVQVKSGNQVVDSPALDGLVGVVEKFKGNHGLLVSWGGFTKKAVSDARRQFFKVRLWHAKTVIEALQDTYDRLSPEMQKKIPLKRIWTLVQPDLEA